MNDTPIPDSYWLLGDPILAGEHPGAFDDDRARQKIQAVLTAGIRSFIDLTQTCDQLKPCQSILRELAADMGIEVSYRRRSSGFESCARAPRRTRGITADGAAESIRPQLAGHQAMRLARSAYSEPDLAALAPSGM